MATKNFTLFNTATPLTTSDYIVGYNAAGTAEIKTQVQSILNLKSDSDAQTLSFNENNKSLSISSGNTVSLSSLLDTSFADVSSSFATNTNLNAVSSLLTPLTLTNTLTSQLVANTNIIPTITNYLSTNNVLVSSLRISNSLTITGNVSGNNLATSFNQGSATGLYSFAVGSGRAYEAYSHAEGDGTTASGFRSHAEGQFSQAAGGSSHAEGISSIASGSASHAEGAGTTASNIASHAEGISSIASGIASHAEGSSARASGNVSHAEGDSAIASGYASHTEGRACSAINDFSHAEGDGTRASGNSSHAEGVSTIASGNAGHAEGDVTIASGTASHAEGISTIASGEYSHAEGYITTASGYVSHAEGESTTASGDGSHAEGSLTRASGTISHAEGDNTIASGYASHAAGFRATAAQDYTYAWSDGNLGTATSNIATTRAGQYMVSASGGMFIPGNVGIGTNNNLNALTVIGTISATGSVLASGPFRIGTSVTSITSNALQIRGGNLRIDGIDLSNVPNITAFDTDGQSLFDLRSAGPSANYNLSIASSGVNNFMKFFGGREGDPRPFIVIKAGQPLRFASYSNFFNNNNDFTEYARIDTAAGNICIGGGNSTVALSAAVLQLDSTTKGFLPPRMTTSQRNTITLPPTGLMVYNTTTNLINYYAGNTWVALATAAA